MRLPLLRPVTCQVVPVVLPDGRCSVLLRTQRVEEGRRFVVAVLYLVRSCLLLNVLEHVVVRMGVGVRSCWSLTTNCEDGSPAWIVDLQIEVIQLYLFMI